MVLAEAVQKLQGEVSDLKRKIAEPPKIVYVGGGTAKTSSFTELLDTIADSQNPNALLLDGTRAMTGDFNLGNNDILFGSGEANFGSVDHLIRRAKVGDPLGADADDLLIDALDSIIFAGNLKGLGQSTFYSYFMMYPSSDAGSIFYMRPYWDGARKLWFKVENESGLYDNVMIFTIGPTSFVDIPSAGDITMLSGKVLNNLAGVFRLPNSAPASPSANDCYFNASTNTLYIYNGTAWKSVVLT